MQVQAHVLHTAPCRFSHSHDVNRTHLVNEPFGEPVGFGHSHTTSVNVERIQNGARAHAPPEMSESDQACTTRDTLRPPR
jgi:hypothetical protein